MGKRNVYIPELVLRRIYEKGRWPISRIANKFGCSRNTIVYWIKKYGIKRRTQSESMKLFVNKKGIEIPKKELIELYLKKGLNRNEIAERYSCSIVTVTKELKKHGISIRRSNWDKVEISKKRLEYLYKNKKLSTYHIAEMYNCCQCTIWKRLRKFNIKARNTHSLYSKIPTKKELIDLYVKKGMSTWGIEKKYGYARSTVHRHLREHGLIKSRAKSHIKYARRDFDGDDATKAYLIGFRLGDLRVRKIWKNSETIHIDCGSTKIEQINLIRNLFQKYGNVWTSKPNKRGKIQIEAFMNLSFSFLLEKKVPDWVLENEKYFFAFLAGFTDAEGCISISRNQAYYSLGNYDSKLLFLIKKKLNKFGIECPKIFECDTSKYFTKDGYGHNQNYWSLRISKKFFLLKFLDSIESYIKHEKKIKDLKRAKKNIIERNKKFELGDLRHRMR